MASGRKFSIRGRLESQDMKEVKQEKRRPKTKQERAIQGMKDYRNTQFAKKIEGHTMFMGDKDMDNWRKPWKFMYDIMLPADAESSFEHREF